MQLKYTIKTNHLLLGTIVILLSCGQSVKGVQQSYLISKTVFPGTPPMQNASPHNIYHPDTINTIYIEAKSGYIPAWVTARQNGRLFSVTTSAVEGDSVQLGQSTNNTPAFIIITQKGNRLWRLQLKEQSQDTNKSSSSAYANKIIFCSAADSNKKTVVQISKQIELMPERRP